MQSSALSCRFALCSAMLAVAAGAGAAPCSGDSSSAGQDGIRIELKRSDDRGPVKRVEVAGLPAEYLRKLRAAKLDVSAWRERVPFRVVAKGGGPQPAMSGKYEVDGKTLTFRPRYPLVAGLTYEVSVPELKRRTTFSLPKPETKPTTVVTAVYPSGNTLPENQLKFYVHFSAPMSRGQAYERIHLYRHGPSEGEKSRSVPDRTGATDGKSGATRPGSQEVDYPFLRLEQELWDPAGKRFTAFIDPGRIKRGLKPREEEGPVLEEGHTYTLVVDRDWEDAAGNPLKESFRKTFQVGPPDNTQPNVDRWTIKPPPAGTRRPLTVAFGEPLDRAMLERVILVEGPAGNVLEGTITIDRHETRWRFQPEKPWQTGRHTLAVDAALEDRAGNSPARPFEVDVFRKVERTVAQETVTRAFLVKATP